MSTTIQYFEHSLVLPFTGITMKTDFFQSCGHCWVFKIYWHIECSTSTTLSFRIWNSSTRIPSPLLALFIVSLPKVHLTSHSRMSDSGWVITPSWLSGSLRSFLYSYSVYSCHLFLISSASVRSLPFLSFIMPIRAWNILLISPIFLKRSLVFPILLFFCFYFLNFYYLFVCSFKKAFLYLLAISGTRHSVGDIFPFLPCLSLFFFPQLFVKPPQTTTLPSFLFFRIVWSLS